MEHYHNNLSYMPYSGDFGKPCHTDESMVQSTGSSNLSESEVLVSGKSPTFSYHLVYQPSGLHRSSVQPPVHPQGNSTKDIDKDFVASTNVYRVAGLDMTNKITSVNMLHNRQTKCTESNSYNVSKPVTNSEQIIPSSVSKNDHSRFYGSSIIDIPTTQISNQSLHGSQSLHTSYVPCDEKSSVNCLYKCGGCDEKFYTICQLHAHIKTHNENGSYYFSESTKTAYPKFVTHCKETQTTQKCYTEYAKLLKEDLYKSSNDNVQVKEPLGHEEIGLMTNVTNSLLIDNEPEIKIEEKHTDCVVNEVNDSGSDTDHYKPDESVLLNQRKRQKNSKRKRNEIKKVKTKGSKRLKKLKMTIKLKQEGKKENRVSFVKKDRKSKARSNMKINKTKVEQKITCKLCKEDFTKRLFLKHHIKAKHSDVEYLCQLCGEQFTVDEELIEHRKTVHNRGYHRCELCDKVLSTKGMLEGHYLVHKGIKPFACDICVPKKEFTRKCQLKAHMDTHSTEKTLQCEFCGKPFNARYLMLSHVKHCGGIKPHKCEYCEMSFVSNHCLQRHRRTHTGEKPFVCEVCAFASSNSGCLARHMRTHTGEKPFSCQFCQQTFAARGALKKHVRIHTQEKPYKCRFCTKAFTQNWNLKTHERQHTGETPYKCHVCGIGYKQNVLLKTHLRTHFGHTSDNNDTQSPAVNHSVSQSLTDSQTNLNCQSHLNVHTTFKSESLKSEYQELQSVNRESNITELHSQPLVPNILLSSFLHSGYNMS